VTNSRIFAHFGYLWGLLLLCIGGILFVGASCVPLVRRNNVDFYRQHPKALLVDIERNTRRLQTLQGCANLTVESAAGSYNGYANIYYVAPDSLIIQLQAMVGIHAAVLKITEETVQLYLPREKTLYQSDTQSLNLSSLLGMPLEVEQLFMVVTGLPHLLGGFSRGEIPIEVDGKYFLLRWLEYGQEWRYYIDPGKPAISIFTVADERSKRILRLELRRFQTISKVRIPRHIQLIHLPEKERISLYYRWIKINRSIKTERFKIKLPKDVKIVSLSS